MHNLLLGGTQGMGHGLQCSRAFNLTFGGFSKDRMAQAEYKCNSDGDMPHWELPENTDLPLKQGTVYGGQWQNKMYILICVTSYFVMQRKEEPRIAGVLSCNKKNSGFWSSLTQS